MIELPLTSCMEAPVGPAAKAEAERSRAAWDFNHKQETKAMKNKTVLTSSEAAKICDVSTRTIGKWFDEGRLRGYRMPGSRHRRIPRQYLIEFLKEHGMPLGELEDNNREKHNES